MRKFSKYLALFPLIILMVSCADITTPTTELVIKSRTKYLVNSLTYEREYKIYTEEYDTYGQIVSISNFNDEGEVIQERHYIYTDNTSQYIIYRRNDVGDLVPKEITTSEFDANGKLKTSLVSNMEGDTIKITTYKYDNHNNLSNIHIKDYLTGEITKVSYNLNYNNNDQLESKETYSNDELVKTQEYQYSDNRDNSITVRNISINGNTITVQYTMNESRRVINEIHYNANSEIINIFEYEYLYH